MPAGDSNAKSVSRMSTTAIPVVYKSCGFLGFNTQRFDLSSVCSQDTIYTNGKCVSTVDVTMDNPSICGAGTEYRDGTCKLACPAGTQYVESSTGGECADVCGSGTEYNNNKCLPSASVCGGSTEFINGRCQIKLRDGDSSYNEHVFQTGVQNTYDNDYSLDVQELIDSDLKIPRTINLTCNVSTIE
jgi:hypothetical protein